MRGAQQVCTESTSVQRTTSAGKNRKGAKITTWIHKDGTPSNPSTGRSRQRTMFTPAKPPPNKISLGATGSVKKGWKSGERNPFKWGKFRESKQKVKIYSNAHILGRKIKGFTGIG